MNKGRERRRTKGGIAATRRNVRIGVVGPQGDLPIVPAEARCLLGRSVWPLPACAMVWSIYRTVSQPFPWRSEAITSRRKNVIYLSLKKRGSTGTKRFLFPRASPATSSPRKHTTCWLADRAAQTVLWSRGIAAELVHECPEIRGLVRFVSAR